MKIITSSKLTADCFKDFSYRDSDFDACLPKEQKACEGEVTIKTLGKEMTFLEMAQEFLGTTDVEEIKKHTLTLPMVEEMIKNHESELNTEGYVNFFFVESNNGVSVGGVGRVYRGGRGWHAFVYSLGHGYRWDADRRLLLPNLGHSDTKDSSTLSEALEIVKEAGYEVTPTTLQSKFREYTKKHKKEESYWNGLAKIAEIHFLKR